MSASSLLDELPPDARRAACEALDAISRPLTNAEIDKALFGMFSRGDRRRIIRALSRWAIIAIEAE